MSDFELLKQHILSLSRARDFDSARREWRLVAIEYSKEFGECPCTQPIKEHCFIANVETGQQTHVGNVCINRFLDIDTGNLFDGLRRIMADVSASPNQDLIEHAQRMGYLYPKEAGFLRETMRKRTLSPRQMAWRMKINQRILRQAVVQRRSDAAPRPSAD